MSITKLHIRLDMDLGSQSVSERSGVVTNIYAIDKGSSANSLRNIVIPITNEENIYRTVELESGSYLIESILPSGEIISKEVYLEPDEPQRVSLQMEQPPLKGTYWQELTGNVSRQNASKVQSKSFEMALGGGDPLQNGIVEITNGDFHSNSFTGREQWTTLLGLIGSGAEKKFNPLMERTKGAIKGDSTADGFVWIPGDEYSFDTNVFDIQPVSRFRIRDFLYWIDLGRTELIKLPDSWQRIPISIMTELGQSDDHLFRTSIAVQDPNFATILGYLTSGLTPQASKLFDKNLAEELLYSKVTNPYAAAVGGYLLLIVDEPSAGDYWPLWIENLRNGYEWLPDGAILLAWLKILIGDLQGAIEELKVAFSRGIPLYSLGIKRLLDGLSLVSSEDEECKKLEQIVRKIGWRTNMSQYFTVIRLGEL